MAEIPPSDPSPESNLPEIPEANLLDFPDGLAPLQGLDVLIFADRFHLGGEKGSRAALLDVLREPWKFDVHLVQYLSDENVRLRKDLPGSNLRFHLIAIDLDGPKHIPPSDAAWERLLEATSEMEPAANVIYRTRAGARLVFVIEPIFDPIEFEQKRLLLLAKVRSELGEGHPYVLDETKDWTRLFRAPRVLRRNDDGTVTDLHGIPVIVRHTRRLRLVGPEWTPPTPPRVRRAARGEPTRRPGNLPTGTMTILARKWLALVTGAVSGERGHDKTFWVACELFSTYRLDEESVLALMEEWNEKCEPRWSRRELEHKVRDAKRRVTTEADDE